MALPAKLYLFLDYDGTLVPIRKTPAAAVLSGAARTLLRQVAAIPGMRVGIISGRSLRDIKRMVGIPGIVYAGNHGFEIDGPGLRFTVPVNEQKKKALVSVRRALARSLGAVAGVRLEHKGLTLSVHYRQARPAAVVGICWAVRAAVAPFEKKKLLELHLGKKVLEVRPSVSWDKGAAVRWILQRESAFRRKAGVVYMGDDVTDESAFSALGGRAVTVRVGQPKPTAARFRLEGPSRVLSMLAMIKEVYDAQAKS